MLKALIEFRKAMKEKKSTAGIVTAETLLDHEKRLCLLEAVIGREARTAMKYQPIRGAPPKHKDGREKVYKVVGKTEDGEEVWGWA